MARQTLADWLRFIEQGRPDYMEFGLERVREVGERLGVLQPRARVFTVAGTNGKGSCAATLTAGLRACGRRVGTYTSPHLQHWNERVCLDGVPVDDATLCAAFEAVEAARGATPLTFFEYGTLAAFAVFARAEPDELVLEIGLGGRLDAVNVIDPDIAVITGIALDHLEWLGSDRESIAREKAGIMRAGRPVVIGDRDPPIALRETARALAAPCFAIGSAFDCGGSDDLPWWWRGSGADGAALRLDGLPQPALHPDNVACALQALALAGQLPARAQLDPLLASLALAGRFQRLHWQALDCVLDVAHNPAGVALLRRRLAALPPRRTIVVLGAMADKDLTGMLAELGGIAQELRLVGMPGSARAAAAEALADAARQVGITVPLHRHAAVEEALDAVAADAGSAARLVVCGSFQTVGPALGWLQQRGAVA